jgi:RNA polymerase sigma-70 factor (ECF subfamily)
MKNTDVKQAEFERLVLGYLDPLYRFAWSLTRNRTEADDLVQKSVMKAYRAFDRFERGTNVRAWLFRILRNAFISDYRKMKRRAEQSIDEDDAEFSFYAAAQEKAWRDSETLSEDALLKPEKLERVLGDEVTRALETLPEEFREVVFMCDIQGFSYQEMAGILNVPVGTVRSRLARARGKLQKILWAYAQRKGLWRRKIV